ncbi:hypothetical protein [Amycolatopsis sp. lyj-108]|uniref:hypothetical protein n=1 Tax=Amycolatopsis sp. lyj-108 TaxID=2789286 RepID=UPI0039790BD4
MRQLVLGNGAFTELSLHGRWRSDARTSRSAAIQTVEKPGRPIPAGCVRLTDSVRLLPTPTASDAKNCTHDTQDGGPSLPDRARALSTPAPPLDGPWCAAAHSGVIDSCLSTGAWGLTADT